MNWRSLDIVHIVWWDAVSDEGIFKDTERDKVGLLKIHSFGALWFEDEDKLVLSRDFFQVDNFRGFITIPKNQIVKRDKITNMLMGED